MALEQIDAFMAAISGQESGGDPNIVNKDSGAHGQFQIMPANWIPWAREAGLGNNPPKTQANQNKVARFKMQQYYNQFGSWDAVAVAWYSGPGRVAAWKKNPNAALFTRKQGGGKYPSIKSYAQQIMARMATDGRSTNASGVANSRRTNPGVAYEQPANETLTAGTDGPFFGQPGAAAAPAGLPPGATPAQIEQYIRENFPQAAGFLDVPEVRQKLIDAAKGQWTSTKLQAEIQATTWWRTNGEATRQYHALKGTDPAQFQALIDAKVAELTPEMQQLGITGDVRAMAEESLKFGWDANELRSKFATNLQAQSDQSGLQQDSGADVTADGLLAMARNEYLMPISRQDAERWAIDIYAGRKTEDQVRAMLLRQGQARFPGLAEGFSPGEYMAPVRNVIAETLELDPSAVDLLDRRWSAVLEQGGDEKGGFRPMSISEAQRWARSQTEYRFTKGAQGEAAAMAETLGQNFGAVA